jgi:WD domain, G-beta repeat
VLRTFRAHETEIVGLNFSPDGRLLATAGGPDKTVGVWDVVDGHRIARLSGHTGTLNAVVFSPDGSLIASSASEPDATIRLWDVATRCALRTLLGHQTTVYCLAFSRDGRYLFSGSRDETIRIWDVETGRTLHTYRGHSGSVKALSLSPDGRRLASGGDDRTIRIWDIASGQELQTLQSGTALELSFSQDGSRLVAGSLTGAVMTWDARPLTDGLRAELVAADFVSTITSRAGTLEEVLRQIRERPAIEESVRQLALRIAGPYWQYRSNEIKVQAADQDYTDALSLSNRPDAKLTDINRAVELAKKAVELVPIQGKFWNALGVAQYRAGNWKAGLAALEKSMQIRGGGDAFDWFFAAMSNWRLGARQEALKWYDRAVAWTAKYKADDVELQRFKAEACTLLRLTERRASGAPSNSPSQQQRSGEHSADKPSK